MVSYTRWRKTPTTFGPIGRVLLTILVITIGLWLLLATAGIGDLGGIMWMLVVTPWCLRDIWKAGQLPVVPLAEPRRSRH